MALEIERKFLLANAAWRAEVERSVPMWQAYLGGDGVSLRVRIAGDEALINIKQNRLGFEREEFEYPVPMADALKLAAMARGGSIRKIRHFITHAGMLWEIDEFRDDNEGLVVAEIELVAADQPFARPAWLGSEVTNQERYYNVALARLPFRDWPAQDQHEPKGNRA